MQSVAESVADDPTLTPEQAEAAIDYAEVYPRTGRPLPTRSFKCMVRDDVDVLGPFRASPNVIRV